MKHFNFVLTEEEAEDFFELFQDKKVSYLESKLTIEAKVEEKAVYLEKIDEYIKDLESLKQKIAKGMT